MNSPFRNEYISVLNEVYQKFIGSVSVLFSEAVSLQSCQRLFVNFPTIWLAYAVRLTGCDSY